MDFEKVIYRRYAKNCTAVFYYGTMYIIPIVVYLLVFKGILKSKGEMQYVPSYN
jgi:hypothetical protein